MLALSKSYPDAVRHLELFGKWLAAAEAQTAASTTTGELAEAKQALENQQKMMGAIVVYSAVLQAVARPGYSFASPWAVCNSVVCVLFVSCGAPWASTPCHLIVLFPPWLTFKIRSGSGSVCLLGSISLVAGNACCFRHGCLTLLYT